jgi:hypothetical protein
LPTWWQIDLRVRGNVDLPPSGWRPVDDREGVCRGCATLRAMPRQPIPDSLTGRAFTTAEAHQAGLKEGRLRGPDLDRPLHGVRQPSTAAVPDPRDRSSEIERSTLSAARTAALVIPGDAAFSHCTAALIHRLPLPRSHEHDGPLHVMRWSARNPVDRPQVKAHLGLESRKVTTVRGVRVVEPVDTWVDLASLLGVEDLVVVGDQVARRAGSLEPLQAALARRRRVRGVRALHEAMRWIRVGSDSAMETRSRLLFVRHGLPEPELNEPVNAEDGSGFVCRGDFIWRRKKVIGEYQGSHHFESFERGDDDISRRLLVEDDDWKYVELTKRDYFNPARRMGLLRRLARYLDIEVVENRPHPEWTGRFATRSTGCASAGRRR